MENVDGKKSSGTGEMHAGLVDRVGWGTGTRIGCSPKAHPGFWRPNGAPRGFWGGVRSGRSTGVTGDVTVVPAGSEARAVPTPTQSSHRDRLDARGERLRAGQNKYYLAYAQSLHTEAFWRPSVSSEKP